jgi:hypothetical protein
MYLPNQSKPVQRKRSYSIINKGSMVGMSDDEMEVDDDENEEMEALDDEEGGDDN